MSKGEYKNVHNRTHKPTYKVKIRPLFFSGLSLPNPECSSCLLNGGNFYKKYGKSSLSYQHGPSLIYSNTVSFFKTKFVDHRTLLFIYVNIRGKIPDFCDFRPRTWSWRVSKQGNRITCSFAHILFSCTDINLCHIKTTET